MNILLRGEGKMKVAMLIASCSCFLNIVLASVLIAWVGWGIQGAAWATVIAQLAYFLCQTCFHWRGNTRLRLMSAKLRGIMRLDRTGGKGGYTGHTDADYEHYPGGAVKVLALSGGANHLALMTAAMRCYLLIFFIIFGIAYGMQLVVGMNFGVRDYERTKYAWKYFTAVSVAITSAFWLLFMAFPGLILGWFISEPELVEIEIPYFRMLNIPLLIMGAIPTTMLFFIAVEQPKPAGKLAIIRQMFVFVPLVLILRALMQVQRIWLSLPITDALTALMGFAMIFREVGRLKEKT